MLDDVNRTGTGRYTYNLVRELVKKDVDSYYSLGEFYEEGLFHKSKQIQIDIPHSSVEYANKLLALNGQMHDLDLLYSPFFPIPERRAFKGVLTVLDVIQLRFPELFVNNTLFDRYIRSSIKTVDHVIAISQATKNDIMEFFNVEDEKISVIYPGIDPIFEKVISNTGQDTAILNKYKINMPYILSVCTIEPRKNLSRTLAAYELVRKRTKEKMALVLVGGLGWDYQKLLQELQQFEFKEDIIMTGFAPDEELPALYRNAEVFVYPSLFEGFGLPILEAMACGVPVVTSFNSSLPEVGGDAVVYCNPYEAESIAEAIISVVLSPTKRQELIALGHSRAKLFTYKDAATRTHELFQSILQP
ncbi:glycosyltransferase [Paenibacillus sp. LMG 31461]|uniref:Glycosyltransferase n=1 Tax=Paenibacillus plantarum TaxID=2654975 RepID=A0ABX1XFE0_9BACL|nr:glycosyltransferase family 1 protein [Paenibacillus plantarum]NOU66736.1 glycosyltransferase [Paenibacillus plantarum]